MAISSDSNVMAGSYPTGIGNAKASMPTKCIDQMPVPITQAAPTSHQCAARPWAVLMRPAMSSTV
ncbi:hypothetical protein BSE24067_01518 [Burkholderia seminalis]|nr:hypothetical protein BSE24067_01518 [Burkholderia seminalis]